MKLACVAVCMLGAGYAQQLETRPPVLQLSLKKAVEIALAPEGSTRLQLAQEVLKESEARTAEARAALLPDFEGQVTERNFTENLQALGLQFSTLIPIPGLHIPALVGPVSVLDVRASVNQNVFDFASIRRFQSAKATAGAAKSDVDAAREQTMDATARAYLAGLRAQAAVETAKADVELSQALLRLAESQKAAGTATAIEVTRANVQLANDRQRLLVAQNDSTRANLQLLKTIGVRLNTPVELVDKLAYVPVDTLAAENAVKQAHAARPDLKAQQEREESAKLAYSSIKYERLPSVSAFGDYGAIGTN